MLKKTAVYFVILLTLIACGNWFLYMGVDPSLDALLIEPIVRAEYICILFTALYLPLVAKASRISGFDIHVAVRGGSLARWLRRRFGGIALSALAFVFEIFACNALLTVLFRHELYIRYEWDALWWISLCAALYLRFFILGLWTFLWSIVLKNSAIACGITFLTGVALDYLCRYARVIRRFSSYYYLAEVVESRVSVIQVGVYGILAIAAISAASYIGALRRDVLS